jgi:hypothetical protein
MKNLFGKNISFGSVTNKMKKFCGEKRFYRYKPTARLRRLQKRRKGV